MQLYQMQHGGGRGSVDGSAAALQASVTRAVNVPPGARRPFLQITVLFGSDPKVMQYARSVQNKFFDSGVDVYIKVRAGEQRPPVAIYRQERLAVAVCARSN